MRRSHGILGALALGAALPLAACDHVPDAVNPVAWYRDVSGISKNDAQDLNQRNEANLAQGGKEPYPNLADVPDVPDRATSGIDRKKLTESLVADRENAKYSNEQLQAGRQLTAAAPPPAPNTGGNAAATGSASTATASATSQTPVSPPPAVSPPAAPPSAPAVATRSARQAAPMESDLKQPTMRSAPQGETPAAAPGAANVARSAPPPSPPPPSPLPGSAPPPAPSVVSSAPPASAAVPAGVRSGGQPALAMRTPAAAANAISVSVGDITFAPGSASLSAAHRGALSEIAGLYKQAGGKIRIVGHAERSSGGDAVQQRMTAFNLAVDRANAVAQALATMGVPAEEMTVQTAPERGGQEIPRAEVFMEY